MLELILTLVGLGLAIAAVLWVMWYIWRRRVRIEWTVKNIRLKKV